MNKLIAPQEGEGLHQWLLMESRDLLVNGVSPEATITTLLEATRGSGRTTQDIEGEITNAVEGAMEFLREHSGFVASRGGKKKAWVDPLSFVGLDDVQSRRDKRPARLPINPTIQRLAYKKSGGLDKEGLEGVKYYNLDALYGGINFLLCVTIEQSHKPHIVPMDELLDGKARFQYIVPNPMRDDYYGRCDFGTGERMFMVVEFDNATFAEQIAYLIYLERHMKFPLAMVVFSGNKSYHGWFACYGQSESRCKSFSRMATELGADRTTYSPSQYVRMPEGFNYRYKKTQRVIYFDENKLEVQYGLLEQEFNNRY